MNMGPLLAQKPKLALEEFLPRYCAICHADIGTARKIINDTLLYERSKDADISLTRYFTDLTGRWYRSLSAGDPDYSVYDDEFYFTDLWLCWLIYSRKYLRSLTKARTVADEHSILDIVGSVPAVIDVGCGIGYSTAALAQLFPRSKVYGLNLADTKQYRFCQEMSAQYKFTLVSELSSIPIKNGLVFASEYFEHIESPINHLQDVIRCLRPKFFLIANSFNTYGLGHFKRYKHIDANGRTRVYDQSKLSRGFNSALKASGYTKVRTKLWNNKPALYVRAS